MELGQLKGLLLDMDGLLLDTERVSAICWESAEKETGFSMPDGFYHTLIGRSMAVISDLLHKVMPPECDVEEFIEAAERIYTKVIHEESIPIKKGVRNLLQLVQDRGIPVCLVTSTTSGLAATKLERTALEEFLPKRICGDHVEESKPHPEIYLKAAALLDHDPESLLAVEDSSNGITSALGAGCKVAHVPDVSPVPLELQQRVHRVYRDLDELAFSIENGELKFA